MSVQIAIKLERADGVYSNGETCTGFIVVDSSKVVSHGGIAVTVEGTASLQLSARSVGIFEALSGSTERIDLMKEVITVCSPGKLQPGVSKYPFRFKVKPLSSQPLLETYHGVYINVKYYITANMSRGIISRTLSTVEEFFIHGPKTDQRLIESKPQSFVLSDKSTRKVLRGGQLPIFLIEGKLDGDICRLPNGITGVLRVVHSDATLMSIDLQLLRCETICHFDENLRETTEVQSIQIAQGDVARNLDIPVYMVPPRNFTCVSSTTTQFRIEFELNIIVTFTNRVSVTENIPLRFLR